MLDNKLYCFLTSSYVNPEGSIVLYECILADTLFDDIEIYYTDVVGLRNIVNLNKLNLNFKFENDFLMSVKLPSIAINDIILEKKGKFIKAGRTVNGFHKLMCNLLLMEAIYIDDSVLDCSSYTGTAITKMQNVKFSKSTMSCYFQLVINEGLINRHVCRMENEQLKFIPFSVGIVAGKEISFPGVKFLQQMTINNVLYNVYTVSEIEFHTDNQFIDCLTQKAALNYARYENIVTMLKGYTDMLVNVTATSKSSAPWAGGTTSYESVRGCYLETAIKSISKSDLQSFLDFLLGPVFERYNLAGPEDAEILMYQSYFKSYIVEASAPLRKIIFNNETFEEQFSKVLKAKSLYTLLSAITGSYLYELRIQSLVMNKPLTKRMDRLVEGSDEAQVVLVKEIL